MPLPGMFAPLGGMGNHPLPYVSYASGGAIFSSSLVITRPSGGNPGALLIAAMCSQGSTDGTWSGASGWTEVLEQSPSPELRIAYKVASVSEPSNYTFTHSEGDSNYHGHIVSLPVNAYDEAGAIVTRSGNGDLIVGGVTMDEDGYIVCFVASDSTNSPSFSTPSGMTLLGTTNTNSCQLSSFYEAVASGASGSRTCAISSTPNGGSYAGAIVGGKGV